MSSCLAEFSNEGTDENIFGPDASTIEFVSSSMSIGVVDRNSME